MSALVTVAGAVMRDAVRRKVVWVVVVFAALLSFVAPSLPSYGVGVVSAVFREVSVALMFAAAFIVTVVLASTRIPSEVDRRTVFPVLARDVRRWHYVVGTWAGLTLVTATALLSFTVVAIGVGFITYREGMLRLVEGAFAVALEMGVIAAVTVLASTRFGPATSAVAATAFTFIGHSVGTLAGPGSDLPWYVPTLDVFDVISAVAHGNGYGIAYAASMCGVFVALSGLALVAASAVFERRDL